MLKCCSLINFALVAFAAVHDDARIVLSDRSGSILPSTGVEDAVSVEAVQVWVARSMGLPASKEATLPDNLLQTSFFKPAQANMVVTVDGLGASSPYPTPFLSKLSDVERDAAVTRTLPLSGVMCPVHTTTSLTAMSTGERDIKTQATASRMGDVLATAFEGESFVMSMGGDEDEAKAFSANTLPLVSGDAQALLGVLAKAGMQAHVQEGSLVVKMEGSKASFSLDSPLVMELEVALSLLSTLAKDPKSSDNAPDLITLSFSSLKALLRAEEGKAGTTQLTIAMRMLDATLSEVIARFETLYPRGLLTVAMMGTITGSVPTEKEAQEALIRRHLLKAGAKKAPSSNADASRYHIVLWLSLGGVMALVWATYALAFMPFKKDADLYSTFNPNWEHRKRQ